MMNIIYAIYVSCHIIVGYLMHVNVSICVAILLHFFSNKIIVDLNLSAILMVWFLM